jgi:two-component system sensor histidine kinase KdpD
MKQVFWRLCRIAAAAALTWATTALLSGFGVNRSIVSMALLVEILAVATLGDWLLSVSTSTVASLAFSWYFIEAVNSLRITTPEGAVTFSAMVITALTVSQLALRARRRADEAIQRRAEMEQLQRFGAALMLTVSVVDAAERVVENVISLFGLKGAALHLRDSDREFARGSVEGECSYIDVGRAAELRVYGESPSAEFRSALGQVVGLVLDRARGFEEAASKEAARRGDQMRTTILDALAHNFKTPLTSIKAAASTLRVSSDLSSAANAELVSVIDEEADRLDLLIRESLNLARIEDYRLNPRRETCSVPEIVNAVAERVERHMRGRELDIAIPPELPSLRGDRFLFEQMLMQVVDNAWKYSKPGTPIGISAAQANGRVILTVKNEGNPVPDDERDRIFGKFYRGAVSRSRVEGTGLGLAIAKAIAEAHGGAVWVDTELSGPAFRFSLPVGATGNEG